MTEAERSKIVSQDYADFIIDYRNNPRGLERYSNYLIHVMNEAYAVVHLPVSQFTSRSISEFGYAGIPKLFGLCSNASLEASGVDDLRRIPNFNLRGQGVLIGIVDTGIDYTNPVFIRPDGTSKIVSIWDQTIDSETDYPEGTYFGTQYTTDQINQALASETPLNVVPSTDTNGHGTMLAAIAAGNDVPGSNFYGVAPDAQLIIVKVKPAKNYLKDFFQIPEDVLCFQENSIMWGAQYCGNLARQLKHPIAICMGIGTSQGPHDGRTPLSTFLSIIGEFPRVGIISAAGNEGNLGRHYHGMIDPSTGYNTVELNVGENEGGFSMQLWGDSPGIYSVDILSPSGEFIPKIAPSLHVSRELSFIFDKTIINIDYLLVEAETGDQLILFRFRDASGGVWRFNVYGQGDLPTGFHIWLPMGDMITTDTYFIQPDIYTTILDPGTAIVPITVTAYNPINGTLFVNSSRGYTRSNTIKPELAAPGVDYTAPNLNKQFTTFTGTGVAAAHTAGITALVFEWGVVRGNQPGLDSVEIKKYLIRGAKRSANLTYPNRDWGYGILDIFNVFDVLRTEVGAR
ncbi:MAG TPA: S8 family peptidase [Mobilitalea sp.]|nr:S8 family peptidase [Mobilitalea sp.]